MNRGDFDKALELCREGCEQFPGYPTGFVVLSRCLQKAGELEEARAALDQALRLDPDNPGGFARLSELYQQLGVETLALKCLEHASKLDPFNGDLAQRAADLARSVQNAVDAEQESVTPVDTMTGGSQADSQEVVAVDDNAFGQMRAEVDGQGPESSADKRELDPDGNEPLAAVEPMSEWDETEAASVSTESMAPEVDHGVELPPQNAVGCDEVAALGAELFGEESDELDGSSASPEPTPTVAASLSLEDADDQAGAPSGRSEAEDLREQPQQHNCGDEVDTASATEQMSDGDDASHDEIKTDGDEFIGAPFDHGAIIESGDPGEPREVVPPVEGATPQQLESATATAADDVVPAHLAGKAVPIAADATPEPQVSRISTSDDTELVDLFHEIESQPVPEEGTGQTARLKTSSTQAGPIPTVMLAELYTRQGFAERAIVTYRQILAAEPDNEEVKSKLSLLERSG